MAIRVLKPGLLSTVQDLGRNGYRKEGIIVGGAMDALALRIGNLLLGNDENAAGIECTLVGPQLLFESAQLICITGADLSAHINGVPLKMWSPLLVNKGECLSFAAPRKGCRAYITVRGGFDLPMVLDSRSTYLKAGFGGLNGRALQKGDQLKFASTYKGEVQKLNWRADISHLYPDPEEELIRVIEGPEFSWFDTTAQADLEGQFFNLSLASDRMGYQLEGPKLKLRAPKQLLSSAVAFGTIQVTGSGSPIVLMADHQTTGGYPRIGQVPSIDWSILAQKRSGHQVRFQLISLAEAHMLLTKREKQIKLLKQTIMLKGGFS